MTTLEEQRTSFISQSSRFLAFPLAGAIVWLGVGIASLLVSPRTATYILLFASGTIFPLALLIARITGQRVFQPGNPFATLMGLAVLMVNLLWALHLVLVARLPALAPLSIALGLGLHWIVFGWIIQSPIGLVHAIARTILCTASFLMFPAFPVAAVAAPVVICYGLTMVQLGTKFGQVGARA